MPSSIVVQESFRTTDVFYEEPFETYYKTNIHIYSLRKQGKYVTLKVSLGVKSFLKNFLRSIFQAQSVSNLSNFCAFNGNDHDDYSEHSPCRF